jgi:hypothetical protein
MDDLWRELSLGQKSAVMQTDPTLRYFDQATVEAVALGKPPNFSIEKVRALRMWTLPCLVFSSGVVKFVHCYAMIPYSASRVGWEMSMSNKPSSWDVFDATND